MTIWGILSLAAEYWYVLVWVAAVIAAFVMGGRKWAWIVGTAGLGAVIYNIGRKDERDYLEEHYREVQENRERAYDEIDNRRTDRDDVVERLRDRSY